MFICYKETAEDGGRTPDSVKAQEIYDALTGKGLKVFFARITRNTSGGNNTQDKVFLLSYAEAGKYFVSNSARQCEATEYAKAQGAYVSSSNGNSWWWLRSPVKNAQKAAHANFEGGIFADGTLVNNARGAVRPAIMVDLNAPM